MEFETARKRLRQVVDAYGADPRRWPADERLDLVEISASEADSDWMIEARALDRVLDRGMVEETPSKLGSDLAATILARAATTPQIRVDELAEGQTVVDFTAAASARATSKPRRYAGFTNHLPEAAVLAASLLLGIWAGGIDGVGSEIMEFSQVAGLAVSSDDETNFINTLVGLELAEGEDLL
ncbi:MAG: hypothetical protein ACC631_10490 [Halocynthiibacter sp.]